MIVDCPAEVWYGTKGAIVRFEELKLHDSGIQEALKDNCEQIKGLKAASMSGASLTK